MITTTGQNDADADMCMYNIGAGRTRSKIVDERTTIKKPSEGDNPSHGSKTRKPERGIDHSRKVPPLELLVIHAELDPPSGASEE